MNKFIAIALVLGSITGTRAFYVAQIERMRASNALEVSEYLEKHRMAERALQELTDALSVERAKVATNQEIFNAKLSKELKQYKSRASSCKLDDEWMHIYNSSLKGSLP